jgi:hypothetical protein
MEALLITLNDDDDDVVHFYSAHIHSIECSGRLADVLACSQKVSHPLNIILTLKEDLLTFGS